MTTITNTNTPRMTQIGSSKKRVRVARYSVTDWSAVRSTEDDPYYMGELTAEECRAVLDGIPAPEWQEIDDTLSLIRSYRRGSFEISKRVFWV